MKTLTVLILLGLSCLLYADNTITPRSGILPNYITSKSNVSIKAIVPLCTFPASPEQPNFYHLSDDNHITFVFQIAYWGMVCPGIPEYPIFREIGQLPEGEYTMQAYITTGPVPENIDEPLGQAHGDLVRFTVYAPAAAVPTTGLWGILLIAFTILLSVAIRKRRAINSN